MATRYTEKPREVFDTAPKIGFLPEPPAGTCPRYLFLRTQNYCGRTLLDGSNYCYWHTQNTDKYKAESIENYFGQGVTLAQALAHEIAERRSLECSYLADAPLGGNWFVPGCNLSGGDFVRANFSGAHLSYSNLEGANFGYAKLEGARLSDCRITGVHFIGARLFDTKFRNNSFEGVTGLTRENFKGLKWSWFPIYRMLEEYPDQCEGMYRKLATYFASEGLFDDASWAAYRACVMRHRLLSRGLSTVALWTSDLIGSAVYEELPKPELSPFRKFGIPWAIGLWAWCRSLMLRIIMGYGEKPLRVVANAICAIWGYAVIYYLLGAISEKTFLGSLYFSLVTFTTLGYGDLAPRGPFRLLAGSEALVGILLSGLFIFCLGRRSVGRA